MTTTSHDIGVTLAYYQPKADGSAPDEDDLQIILGKKDMDPREVVIHDIRGNESSYLLDSHGFQIVRHTSKVDDFKDEGKIQSVYYPEIEEIILKNTGASKIIIFNHLVRSNVSGLVDETAWLTGLPGPAPRVHVDQTSKGAQQVLFRMLPHEQAAEIDSKRWQIINAWRPLRTIRKDPLAFVDSSCFPVTDLVSLPRMYLVGDEKKKGENCTVKADGIEHHKWYYLFEQQPDELLLFKQHDSDPEAKAHGVPHSSFPYPGTEHLENRLSIEVRAIVCY